MAATPAVAAATVTTATATAAAGATAATGATAAATRAAGASRATRAAAAGPAAAGAAGGRASAGRAALGRAVLLGGVTGQLGEREGPVPPRRDQEVLPPGGGDEPLQPVVALGHVELRRQVQRRLVDPHRAEELGRRHEDHELQLRLLAPVGNVEVVVSGPVVPHVDRPSVRGPGRPLQALFVAYPVRVHAVFDQRADAGRAPRRVAGALEIVGEEGGTAAVGVLVDAAQGRRRVRAEHVLDVLVE